ncbi:hypothetical protein QOZ80_2AG0119290 [Eleusine coracana subsp. coracana]|nr:hypothetical protein QOZ80_2AG0119290 [Eleusine coracana subsp. coracana]
MGLFLTALGLGGIWPCVPTFGADQFDETNGSEKLQKVVYYNWYQRPGGSALRRICQVIVAATCKANVDVPMDSSLLYEIPGKESAIAGSRKLNNTDGLKFLDRAVTITASDEVTPDRTNPWKLCTVTQVEELKILTRITPVLLTGIIFNTAEALFPLFIEQGEIMDNLIVGLSIPPASLTTFTSLCILILATMYNKVLMPMVSKITGLKGGLSEMQRIGVGMFFAMLSLASAALVEIVRLDIAKNRDPVHSRALVPMNIMWQD